LKVTVKVLLNAAQYDCISVTWTLIDTNEEKN
jgi:hypothetical protein